MTTAMSLNGAIDTLLYGDDAWTQEAMDAATFIADRMVEWLRSAAMTYGEVDDLYQDVCDWISVGEYEENDSEYRLVQKYRAYVERCR